MLYNDNFEKTLKNLSDEVCRLNYSVSKLEKYAASQTVKFKDLSLIVCSMIISFSCLIWVIKLLTVQ